MTPRPRRQPPLAAAIARILLATRLVDWTYRAFDRARSELVAAWAPDDVLDTFNDLAYGASDSYRPGSSSFREHLFPWEEKAIDRFFPKPPAHVLVGGAGGGREAFALIRLGYRVTAFEPSAELARSLAVRAHEVDGLAVYRGRYEDLPHLEGTSGNEGTELAALQPIDAVLSGWGSFSHLRTRESRIAALEALARTTDGPILVSFLGTYDERRHPTSLRGRVRHTLPRLRGRDVGDVFSVYIGFYHRTNEQEVEDLAAAAGLEVVYRNFDARDTNWQHVVLRRARPDA